jgi:hypothetical protein
MQHPSLTSPLFEPGGLSPPFSYYHLSLKNITHALRGVWVCFISCRYRFAHHFSGENYMRMEILQVDNHNESKMFVG